MANKIRIQFQGKHMLAIQALIVALVTSIPQKDAMEDKNFNRFGCAPCSQKFLVSSYFEKHGDLVDLLFEKFVAENFLSSGSCQGLQHNISHVLELELFTIHRELIGEGSHRRLVTSIAYDINSVLSRYGSDFCKLVVIERLPDGIFADPFELQHLVQRSVYIDAAVFGDANLELPSTLSNRSVVEIHMDIQHEASVSKVKQLEFAVDLPLHVRYPSLDSSGYSRVVFGQPDLLIHCTRTSTHSKDCFTMLVGWNTCYPSKIAWQIPCGDAEHNGVVSALTFASAVLSATIIVYSARYTSWKDAKARKHSF